MLLLHIEEERARDRVVARGDLLELYCGNGNFCIALASYFRRILATEVSKTSVRSAQYNIKANTIDNIDILRNNLYLEQLIIARTNVSSLDPIMKHERLKKVEMQETKIEVAEKNRFKKKHPKVRLLYY